MIAPEWLDPETPPWTGPDAGLPTLYEYVESAGPFVGREGPALFTAPSVLAPRSVPDPTDRGARTEETAGSALALASVAAPEPEAASEPEAEPEPEREPSVLQQLALVPDVKGPHVRMALAWAVITVTAAVIGRFELATWLAAVALVAGGQVVRSWRGRPVRPTAPVVVFGAAAVPLGAAFGTIGLAVAAGAVVVAAVVAPLVVAPPPRRGRENPGLTLAFALGLGMAAAAPVIARQRGLLPALVLLTLVGVYDASAFVVGAGASNVWEGPAAGAAFVAAVTLLVAGVFVPPFTGVSPWVLGAAAAVLAPFGPVVGSLMLGERAGPAQAVRRLDSLLVAGPVWAAASLVLLKP